MTRHRPILHVLLVLILLGASLTSPRPAGAVGATFVVNSILDTGDATPDGSCDDGAGNCTLRAAIQEANATIEPDTIVFAIPGAGPHVIAPGPDPLPPITNPVTIDGYSQPGSSPNTVGFGAAGDAVITVELDGQSVTNTTLCSYLDRYGLCLKTNDAVVRGLAIHGFLHYGILVVGARNVVAGNHIGFNSAGATIGNGSYGIMVRDGATDTVIGGPSPADRNVVAGSGSGQIASYTSTGTVIQGNIVGLDSSGMTDVSSSTGIVVGANSTPSTDTVVDSNVISGNTVGIAITGRGAGTIITSNRIGTDVTGSMAVPNTGGGVTVLDTDGTTVGRPGEGNLISGNGQSGIALSRSNGNTIQSNLIGTDTTGAAVLGNDGHGISLTGSGISSTTENNTIGGPGPYDGNVIGGNGLSGIRLGSADGNTIRGNSIGVAADGLTALPNGASGVETWGGAQSNLIQSNTIRFNSGAGYASTWLTDTGNTITANSIADNGGLGIDLPWAGITPAVLADAKVTSVGIRVEGSLVGAQKVQYDGSGNVVSCSGNPCIVLAADTTFTLEFFASPAPDPSGNGEGATYLGNGVVTTDVNGDASFTFTLPGSVQAGDTITATFTGPQGQTSEFSSGIDAILLIETAESVGVVDAYRVLPPVVIVLGETIVASEVPVAIPGVFIQVGESLAVVDVPVVRQPVVITVGESIGVADGSRVLPPVVIVVGETIVASEVPGVEPAVFIRVGEGVVVADVSGVEPGVFIQVGESLAVVDVPVVRQPVVITVGESIGVADGSRVFPPVVIVVGETIVASEVPVAIPGVFIQVGESLAVVDVPVVRQPVVITVGESIGVADGSRVLPPVVIVVGETIVASEVPGVEPAVVDVPALVTVAEAPSGDPVTTEAGGGVTIRGGGLSPRSRVVVELHSKAIELGRTTTDESGSFSLTVTLPIDAKVGMHEIVAIGQATDGRAIELSAPIEVLAPLGVAVPSVSLEYSDPPPTVVIRAEGGDPGSTNISVTGLPDGLSAQSTGCPGSDCVLSLSGNAMSPAGIYTAVVTARDAFVTTTRVMAIEVRPEQVEVALSGSNPTSVGTGSFVLEATIAEPDDGHPGNLSLADARITLDSGDGHHIGGACDYSLDSFVVACAFEAIPAGGYEIKAIVDGRYYTGGDTSYLSVGAESAVMALGGGGFDWPSGGSTVFGFYVASDPSSPHIAGTLRLTRSYKKLNLTVESTTLESMVVGRLADLGRWAVFSGGATVRPRKGEPLTGYGYEVRIEDHGPTGTRDTLRIRVWDGEDEVVESLTVDGSVFLSWGDIFIGLAKPDWQPE